MSDVNLETNANDEEELKNPEREFDPVCVMVPRIYDSCGAKDCLRDLTVFFTAENQALIDTATSVRVNKISVITSGAANIPAQVNGLATSTKRIVLYGSDACVKVFSSDTEPEIDTSELDCCNGYPVTMPRATVQISSPMALSSTLTAVTAPVILPFVPEKETEFFKEELVAPVTQQVQVTIGVFTIAQLSRNVQLMMPSYDFCVPRKECDSRTDDPCEAFGKIEFPADSFFPPGSIDSDSDAAPFDCRCR